MPISPRGNSFLVTHGSGADRKRLTVKTHAEAVATEAGLIAADAAATLAALQAAQRGDPSKSLQDAYDRAYREIWVNSKGQRTTVMNAKQMVALLGADTQLVEITADSINDVLDDLMDGDDEREGNSGATANKKLAVLNVMLKLAVDRGWIKFCPRVKRRPEAGQRTYFYSEPDEREMTDAAHHLGLPMLADWIAFGIDSGMRRSEMMGLLVEDCADDHLRLHAGSTKNDAGRIVPSTGVIKAIVQKAKDAGHKRVFEGLTDNMLRGMWNAMRTYLGKQDDPKYIVHVLRHTCATRLAIAGATAPQIMAFMGHKAIQTSIRYIHMSGAQLKGVAELLTRKDVKPALRLISNG